MKSEYFYQPSDFSEIVGQSKVKALFKAAFRRRDFPSAHLFIGPPGTGKTTMAKCIERALNCQNYSIDAFRSCGVCKSCSSQRHRIPIRAPKMSSPEHLKAIERRTWFAPSNNYNVVIVDEIHSWKHALQDRFLEALDSCPNKSMLILTATVDINTHTKAATMFTEAFTSRCETLYFEQLSDKELVKLIRQNAKRLCHSIPGNKAIEIAEQSFGNAREALKLYRRYALLN